MRGSPNLFHPESRCTDFPSFSEGLSLRDAVLLCLKCAIITFPFLFGGTFIEGQDMKLLVKAVVNISLPFRRDFH